MQSLACILLRGLRSSVCRVCWREYRVSPGGVSSRLSCLSLLSPRARPGVGTSSRAGGLDTSLMPPDTRSTTALGSPHGSRSSGPSDPPTNSSRKRYPKTLPRLDANDRQSHTAWKLKAESASRNWACSRRSQRRRRRCKRPGVRTQRSIRQSRIRPELNAIWQNAKEDHATSKDAYHYIVEMVDLDQCPALLAKFR